MTRQDKTGHYGRIESDVCNIGQVSPQKAQTILAKIQ